MSNTEAFNQLIAQLSMSAEAFNQLIAQLKPIRLTAKQWADLNYAVELDDDSLMWGSKSPDDIGDELMIQARRVDDCLRELSPLEPPYLGATLSQAELSGTKGKI